MQESMISLKSSCTQWVSATACFVFFRADMIAFKKNRTQVNVFIGRSGSSATGRPVYVPISFFVRDLQSYHIIALKKNTGHKSMFSSGAVGLQQRSSCVCANTSCALQYTVIHSYTRCVCANTSCALQHTVIHSNNTK